MDSDRAEIVRLAALATGDEKHEASSYSTLDAVLVAYRDVLRVDPSRPDWDGRDRFVLSKGHGPAAFYAVLAWRGFFPEDWLPRFITWGGKLGGHPDRLLVPGVEVSTGSLGHGLPLAVGSALALRARRNDTSRVVVLTGDAELNEGSNWEAVMLAPHLGLGNLTLLVIDNHSSSIDLGPIDAKLRAFGWDAVPVDGRDQGQLRRALERRADDRPTAVVADIGGLGLMPPTMRQQAADTVTEVFLENDRIAIVLAEISTDYFDRAFAHDPLRAVNVGIMEQTMVGVAAGFALEGFHPVAHTITPFLAERALEQVKLDFGVQGLGGTLFSTGASYDYGTDGATHYSPGDVQALATIPGIRIVVPGHATEVDVLMRHALAGNGLTYLRTQAVTNAAARDVAPGRIDVVRRGNDGTVLAVGPMLDRVLEAAGDLDLTVLYATTVWPLDAPTLAREAADAPDVMVVEPFHAGTLAAEVTAALEHRPSRIRSIGVPRQVPREYGTPQQHDREFGLDAEGIGRTIREFLGSASAPTGGVDPNFAGRS